jgi:hypothetical protein
MRAKPACVVAAAGIAIALGCSRSKPEPSPVRATVTCASAPREPVLDCEVEHLSGSTGANVCWVVNCDCAGGTRVSSQRLCQSVLPGSTVRRSIAVSDLGQCERALKSQVSALTVAPL